MRTHSSRTPTEREDELASELRASFAFVVGTMVILIVASFIGLALS